ncbi:MAG: DEAD/DEAH box helicase [Armatimonadota bacterium]|nr:DEAD/DEAH box helicase [Armatimonadota bacterium]
MPSAVLDAWERTYGPELLPVQERAVGAGVLAGESLLVSAPTSSGKTFIGEMAAVHAALSGRRVLYLVPTKALAEARFHEFTASYAPLGLRITVATRDRRNQQEEIARGEFDLAVAVPEKMRALLAERPALAGSLGAVVADELQVLGDPERGPGLELLLGDLVAEGSDLQLVGLSAVLGRAEEVAGWLNAELVRDDRRPVELRKGVLLDGEYHFRQHNDGAEGVEDWPELADGPEDLGERMAQVAAWLGERDGSVLVFVRDKRSTVLMARAIAREADLPAAEDAVAQLQRLEETQATRSLGELAQSGVAFHNADLQFDEREVVEAAFARCELSVLVCTSTLAMGVNLPARNVIVDPRRWRSGGPRGKPTLGAISRADFENMAGRAGRLGCGDEMGRAVLLADGEVQRHVLFATYVDDDFPPLASRLSGLSPLQQVCVLSGSAAAASPGGIEEAWGRTLSARETGLPPGVLPSELREALDAAALHGLVEETAEGGWRPTVRGRLCGTSGLTPRSFLGLVRAAEAADGVAPEELELLLVAALTDEAQAVPLPPPGWAAALSDELAEPSAPCDDLWEVERLLASAARVAPDSASARRRERAARIVIAMQQWRGWGPTIEVERAVRIPAGRLATLAEAVGWAVEVVGRIGRELGWPRDQWGAVLRLGQSVAAGVPEQGLALHGLHIPGLGRGRILSLLDAGICTREALANADLDVLQRLLGPGLGTRALAVACGVPIDPREGRRPEPSGGPPQPASGSASERPTGQLLIIDGERPDRVLVGDEAVELRPAEFKLLRVLARSPQRCVAYEAIYEGMWGEESFVEPAQIYSHRSRLAKKLDEAVPKGSELLRTIPKRGLMLNVPPERVRVR